MSPKCSGVELSSSRKGKHSCKSTSKLYLCAVLEEIYLSLYFVYNIIRYLCLDFFNLGN